MQVRGLQRFRFDFGRDIWLFFTYVLLANIGYGVFTLLFNLYVYALGFREDTIGIFNSVQTFSVAATALTLGTAMSRIGVWRVMVIGLAIYGISDFALAFSTQAPVILVLSATEGAGLAVVITATMPFIIQNGRRAQRTILSTIAFALASLSLTFGSLVGGYAPGIFAAILPMVEPDSAAAYRFALLAGALLGLTGIIPLARMGMAKTSDRPARNQSISTQEAPERARIDVGVFMFVGLITALGTGLVSRFYNVFLQTLGASAEQIGLVYAAAGFAAAGIGLTAPVFLRRFGSLRSVLMIRGVALPVFLLLAFQPWYAVAVLAHIVRMVSVNMAWPLDSTFISELLPGRLRLSVFGWRSSLWNLGIGLSSIGGGWVIVQYGYEAAFGAYVVLTTIGIGLYYLYYTRHPRVAAGDVPSALSSRERARRALSSIEESVSTPNGA